MNATEFCRIVENTLGWVPTGNENDPPYKRYMAEAGKLNRKIKTNPELYTFENLVLTVTWLRRRRHVSTPTGVCWFVKDALKEAPEPDALNTNVTRRIFEAITEAMVAGEPDWVERLARASGSARDDVLGEWNERD